MFAGLDVFFSQVGALLKSDIFEKIMLIFDWTADGFCGTTSADRSMTRRLP